MFCQDDKVGVREPERDQAILDAAAELLCRLGYNKLTMADVADAVVLHRGLVYLRFPSKDQLVEATLLRELGRYAEVWRANLEADPRGGSVASVCRAMVHALKTLPLASAIVARDEHILGKYLRKPGNLLDRLPNTAGTGGFLRAMQDAGACRRDVDARAVAFILDALTSAIRGTFATGHPASADAGEPSSDEVLETLADMLDRTLTPPGGADLAAGKAVLLGKLDEARAGFAVEPAPREGETS
jgi:AcrR family transcriptional regulator